MTTPDTEAQKNLIRNLFTALENQDGEQFSAVISDDFQFSPHGLSAAEYREDEFAFYEAFPDLTNTLDMIVAGEDHVAFRWTFQGTHSGGGGPGPLADYGATDEEVDVTGINIARIEDRQIVEMWAEWDTLNLCHQLGIIEFTEPEA